jgi:3-methyladenine DNA glycosylase AlkD
MTAHDVEVALAKHASDSDAIFLQRFFKTGEGQYGEGDVFIGVRVPQTRAVCKQYKPLPLSELQKLIDSPVHEHRLAALLIAVAQYPKSTDQTALYDFYIRNTRQGRINNWDLVDSSAEHIVGPYLADHTKDILFELARSSNVWERRVAIMSCFHYIKRGEPIWTLTLAEQLLHDPHDLIQKAVGWQLREVGKRCDQQLLLAFLDDHAATMPRTMLRYSLEHLTPSQKAHYMTKH